MGTEAGTEGVILICPECKFRGRDGRCRIGSRRGSCATCNSFAAAVRRNAMNALREMHKEDFLKLRDAALLEEYREIVRKFKELNPEPRTDAP